MVGEGKDVDGCVASALLRGGGEPLLRKPWAALSGVLRVVGELLHGG